MQELLSPKQVSKAIGVSESTLKRWCDKGVLESRKTSGGHRRIPLNAVVQFLRGTGQSLVDSSFLDLPLAPGFATSWADAPSLAQVALVAGDERRARQVLLDLYLAGHTAAQLCDDLLTPIFRQIGELWRQGTMEVYQERRAVEICLRLLYELRTMLPTLAPNAPRAFGCTFSGDPYQLPTAMVELALREHGWRADSYGTNLPAETLCAAIKRVRPRLVWLSVSSLDKPDDFFADYQALFETAAECKAAVAVGGRALDENVRRQMKYTAYCDQIRHVLTLADELKRAA